MDKQKHQSLIKRYISFFAFCLVLLLIAIITSDPIKVEVHSVGGKPYFLFALLFSTLLLGSTIGMAYSTYLGWFQEAKARSNVKYSMEKLANRFFIFRLPIYNPTFIFWFIRIISPIATLLFFCLFLLVVFSAF